MNSLVTMALLNFHVVSGITKGAPWIYLIYTPPVSFRSSIKGEFCIRKDKGCTPNKAQLHPHLSHLDQAFPSATMTLVNFHIVSGITKAAPWTKLIYTPPVSFRSSINSHIVKNGSLREFERGGRGRGERERVIPPPVTFRSSKISHTLKNGSKWVLSASHHRYS